MKRAVKKKDYENLSAENIRKVLALLASLDSDSNPQKPITKKEACAILNISYNTSRLDKILEEFREREEYVAKRKSMNRGKSASTNEIKEAVTDYLQGEPISSIAKRLYRSAPFVKTLLEQVGVPERPASAEEKAYVDIIPAECTSEDFNEGEIVWSAKYHSIARIEKEYSPEYVNRMPGLSDTNYEEKYSSKCYAIYIIKDIDSSDSLFPSVSRGGFNAFSLAYDLGKLEHLKIYGVDLERL